MRWFVLAVFLVLAPTLRASAAAPTPHWVNASSSPTTVSYLRQSLTLPQDQELDFADLFVAAQPQAIIYINGQRVAEVRGSERFAHFAVKRHLRPGVNVFAVQLAANEKPTAVLLSLHAVDKAANSHWLVSGKDWKGNDKEVTDWQLPSFDASAWKEAVDLGQVGTAPWGTPTTDVEHYHQWKQALAVDTAVDPRTFKLPPGYAVELLRSAGKEEGSWISLAFDDRGRLIVGREDKGLLRMTLPEMPKNKLAGEAAAKAIKAETINDTLLECRGILFVGKDLYANANNSKGLYRLRDTNGDDTLDEVKLLRELPGDVGHGRNDLTLGPDGKLYLIFGNDVRYPTDAAPTSPYRNFAQDRLLSCEWNKFLFNSGTPAPGGYVVRTDLEAKTWEVIAGGFRNAYGIAFNEDGEMFTYDADMEWDAGAPWYRPTRINHIVSGGDYGWRQGTDKWRAWYPDSLPSTLDIGLGSPTAVKFAPAEFMQSQRDVLLALDWAYGRIIRVDLQVRGGSYSAKSQDFVTGRPLNVCDVEFGSDGAMYFVTGGRKTQSGIYRVVKQGSWRPLEEPASEPRINQREFRRKLEDYTNRDIDDVAWIDLGSNDPWMRHAARVRLEAQPVALWQQRALAEKQLTTAPQALLALARTAPREEQNKVVARLNELPWRELNDSAKLTVLRAYQLSLIRLQAKPAELSATRERLEPLYPAATVEANDLLCELLVYLESPKVIERTLPLLDAAATPEEKVHYLMCLRLVKSRWTIDQRQAYFTWLQRAESFPGAHYMPRFIGYIRQDAIATLTNEEKQALGKLLEPAAVIAATSPTTVRPFVKAWTLADFEQELARQRGPGDLQQAKHLFAAADCAKCHRIAGEGALVGPDLSGVGKRFSKKDLLLSILEPSRVIDDKYKQKTVVTARGVSHTGQQVAADDAAVSLITDPTQPTKITRIPRSEIEAIEPSLLSPMPVGMINTLTKEEVLLLLDFLASQQP